GGQRLDRLGIAPEPTEDELRSVGALQVVDTNVVMRLEPRLRCDGRLEFGVEALGYAGLVFAGAEDPQGLGIAPSRRYLRRVKRLAGAAASVEVTILDRTTGRGEDRDELGGEADYGFGHSSATILTTVGRRLPSG